MLAKKGYFKLEDGSKSTDEKNADLFKAQLKKANKEKAEDAEDEDLVLKPKRPLNPYFAFNIKFSKGIREKNEGMSIGEISKLVKAKWDSMSDKEKEVYVEESDVDKARANK